MKTASVLIATACLLASCKDKPVSSPETSQTSPVQASSRLQSVFATAPEGEARSIHEARVSAQAGEKITLKGRVMGNAKPFVEGRSAFILGDPEVLTACSDKPGDDCETPWDNCCNTPEEKKKGTATIQVVGEDGRVLKEAIEGVEGLSTLSHLTVTGTVAEGSSAEVLVVHATAIRVEK